MRKLLALLAGCLVGLAGQAQIDYPIFRDTATLQAADSGRLSLEIENLNYLRNYEYFGDIPLSYTLLGYQLMPQLKYQLNPYISFKGGIFLRREFGRPGFFEIEPVFTAKYQKRGLSLIMGNLEGALNHRYIEPIYSLERFIGDRLEQGVQVKLDYRRFWMDWFIDWRKAIILNDPFREELSSGFSTRTKLVDRPQLTIELPAQALVAHKGGQIANSNQNVESLLNTAIGLSFQLKTGAGFLRGINTDHYFAYYKNISGTKNQLYNEGDGWYSTLTFKTSKNIDVDLRYWKGTKFFGPQGAPLFGSISEKRAGVTERQRELLFLTMIYDKQLFKNVWLDLRLEPYYDFRNGFLEYAYSAFLRFNKDFFLKKLK